MDNEMKIREKLLIKMERNYDDFINEIKTKDKDTIIDQAFKVFMYEDLLTCFDMGSQFFDIEDIKLLNAQVNPLDMVYKMWQENGSNNLDELQIAIADGLKILKKEQEKLNYKTFNVEVNLNGKFIIEVKAESQEQAKEMAQELLKDKRVKEALTEYKNNLKIDSKINNPKDRDSR